MKRMKRIWIASGISVVILATTTVAWIKIRNTNDFIPGVNAREMQMNQIVFPDKRNTAASKKSKKEADNWKEKDKASEKLHPEDFTDIPSQAELQNQYNKNQNETNSLAQILATDNSYALNGNISSLVTGQIVSSANGNGDYIGNIYIPSIDGSGSLIHLPGDSDSNTSASGANGSSSGNNTTPDSYPSNGINPSGSHTSGNGGSNTSSNPSSGGNSGNNGGNSSINKPSGDNNTSGQPDSVPSLPGSLIQPDGNFDPNKWNNTVGDDTPITGDPSVDPTKVQCMVTASLSQDSSKENSLYYGQPLTDWNIFCAVCAYWRVDNKFYRINSFNDYFKIGSHPDVATEDFVQTFYYRPTRKSDWIPIEVTIPVY